MSGDLMDIDHPFHIDGAGRTASTGRDDHVRDLIEQLLLTSPGERVNRPSFGSGLRKLPFEANRPELAPALKMSIQASLQQWLGDLVDTAVEVVSEDSTLNVVVTYVVRRTGEEGNHVIPVSGAP